MADYVLSVYSVTLGAWSTAINFHDFGATLAIGAPIEVTITDDDGFLDASNLAGTNVTIADDDQGPITAIEFFTIHLGGTSYDVAIIDRASVADRLLIVIDTAGPGLSGDTLPADTGYTVAVTDEFTLGSPFSIAANTDPVAVDDAVTTNEDTPFNFDPTVNDTDGDGDTLTVSAVTQGANGTVTVEGDGSVTYTPNANYNGADSFTYTVSDGNGGTDTATVNVTVTAVNDAPVAVADTATTAEDSIVNVVVLANDTDVDGDTLTLGGFGQGSNGTVTAELDGSLTYTPNGNFFGVDVFNYTVSDGNGGFNSNTVTVTVTPANDAPVADDDGYSVDEDGTLTVIPATGVLANDSDVDGDTIVVDSYTPASNGTVTLEADGSFTYTPNANFSGTDSFTYTVTDGTLGDSATVTITVNPVNDAPVAVTDTATTAEDNAVNIVVLANDTDVDGDTLTATSFSQGANGTVTQELDGSLTYTPNANFNGVDSFTYEISDGNGGNDSATVNVTVTPVNDAPVGTDDTYVVTFDTPLTVPAAGVLANDNDVDGDTLSATILANPTNGAVTLNGDGSFTYTPNTGYSGADSFTYTVSDGNGGTDTATVALTVGPNPNVAPVAVDDVRVVNEDQVLTDVAPGVLANDTDANGDPLTASLLAQATNGTVVMNADGSFTYTPNANFNGTDSFTYTVSDGSESDVGSVAITVVAQNDDPVAVDDSYSVDEDGTLNVNAAAGVLANDSDIDGDTLTVTVDTDVSNGTLTLNADGSFDYTPDANFSGTDSFVYTVDDGTTTTTATATITVNPINDAPVATDDGYSVDEDGTLNINAAAGVLANDSDVDGDTLTVTLDTDVANGTLTLNADGSFDYTPDADFNGSDSFTYTVSDGNGGTDTATVNITVNPVNDAPLPEYETYSVNEDGTLTVNAALGVLANDTDPDGDTLTASVYQNPIHGSLVLNADGSFVYTPNANYNGPDYFVYEVSDGNGGTDTLTVALTVNPVNDAPVAVDDTYAVGFETPLTVPAAGVLGNDSDIDGDALTATILANPTNGAVTLNADGSFTYTPNTGYSGADSFTYTVSDGNGGTDTATVALTVSADPNVPPVAGDDFYSVDEDTTGSANAALGVLSNDSDGDGDTLTVALGTDVANGTLTLNADGSFSYTPDANFNGADSFTYTVSDGNGGTDTGTVYLTVNPVNDNPVAVNDAYSTDENVALVISAPGPLANDTDVDGDTLQFNGFIDNVSNGTLQIFQDGNFIYTPNAGFVGTDSFTYRATDGALVSNIATVTITVNAVNESPVANNDLFTLLEDGSLTANALGGVLGNDTDGDGDTLTATVDTNVSNGTLTLNADGSFTYVPNADFNGTDSFTYTVSDGNGGTDTGTATFNVLPINDAPVAVNDNYATDEDTVLTIPATGVLSNDYDVDGDPLVALLVTSTSDGALSFGPNGSFVYTPNAGFTGTDSFTYYVNDGSEDSGTATVTITVNPVNDDPVAVDDTATTDEDNAVVIAVLANDSDPESDPLTVSGVTNGTNGTVAINLDGTVTYTPDANFNGTDSFTYTLSDGNGGTDTATVEVTVNPVNDAPVAVNDSYTTGFETELTIPDPGVLANDYDVDGDPLTISFVLQTPNGFLVLMPTGGFTYTPNAGFSGVDFFEYHLDDGEGGTVSAIAEITVEDSGPVYVEQYGTKWADKLYGEDDQNDAIYGLKGSDRIFGRSGDDLLDGGKGNDRLYGEEGDDILIDGAGTDRVKGGDGEDTLIFQGGWYDLGFGGADADTFVFSDILLENNSQDLVMICDYEPGVDALFIDNNAIVTVLGLTALGFELSLFPDGDIVILKNVTSVDDITFLSGNPLNYAPDAVDDAVVTGEDMAITIDVRANDSDPDGDTIWVTGTSQGANGTVVVEEDGRVTYTPNAGFSGTDSFTYDLSDGRGGFDTATVNVVVEADEPPAPDYVLLEGDGGDNYLRGEDDQNDEIYGYGGNDRIAGASGNDLLDGGTGNDKIRGNFGDDILIDGIGNDLMFGGAGDDTLIFQGGAVDRAWGGSGADTFVFGDAFVGNGLADWVKIYGYEAGVDVIDIDQGAINGYEEFSNRVILSVGPDGDRIVIKGIGDFDQITFADDLIS